MSDKRSFGVRIPSEAFKKLEALSEALHVPKSSIVAIAIARMHSQEDLLTKKGKRTRGANHTSV